MTHAIFTDVLKHGAKVNAALDVFTRKRGDVPAPFDGVRCPLRSELQPPSCWLVVRT
jgi:hypothetical protein